MRWILNLIIQLPDQGEPVCNGILVDFLVIFLIRAFATLKLIDLRESQVSMLRAIRREIKGARVPIQHSQNVQRHDGLLAFTAHAAIMR